jgi:hypothetical protein
MSAPEPVEKVGVLTIRAWVEPGGWRARIIRSHDIQGGHSTTSVLNSVDDICDAGPVHSPVPAGLEWPSCVLSDHSLIADNVNSFPFALTRGMARA